jgi:hypothetical protein
MSRCSITTLVPPRPAVSRTSTVLAPRQHGRPVVTYADTAFGRLGAGDDPVPR